MAVYDSSRAKAARYLWSQTDPNFVKDNYYLNTTQLKVDADWPFHANRKLIEEETVAGTEAYSTVEVLVDSVKSEKGSAVSDDWYKITFRDCSRHNKVGQRYRFSYTYDPSEADNMKNVWIGMNQTTLSATSSQVICRCNTTIGSIYTNDDGATSYHYEPVIQPSTLNSAGFDYSEIAIDPNGSLMLIAQYNQYTKQYYINERFVIGNSFVYKVTNIIKSDDRNTYQIDDVGLMRIYLAMDQVGELDDMTKRIAYNGKESTPIPEGSEGNYVLSVISPETIPEIIPEEGLTLELQLKNGSTVVTSTMLYRAELTGTGTGSATDYVTITSAGNSFTILRKKISTTRNIKLTFYTVVNSAEIAIDITLSLRPF